MGGGLVVVGGSGWEMNEARDWDIDREVLLVLRLAEHGDGARAGVGVGRADHDVVLRAAHRARDLPPRLGAVLVRQHQDVDHHEHHELPTSGATVGGVIVSMITIVVAGTLAGGRPVRGASAIVENAGDGVERAIHPFGRVAARLRQRMVRRGPAGSGRGGVSGGDGDGNGDGGTMSHTDR